MDGTLGQFSKAPKVDPVFSPRSPKGDNPGTARDLPSKSGRCKEHGEHRENKKGKKLCDLCALRGELPR